MGKLRSNWLFIRTVAEAILLLAILVSWVASFRHRHTVALTLQRQYMIIFDSGVMELCAGGQTELTFDSNHQPVVTTVNMRKQPGAELLSFKDPPMRMIFSAWRPFQSGTFSMTTSLALPNATVTYGRNMDVLSLPYWLPVLLVSIGLAWHIRQVRKRLAGRAAGLCPVCGYDLRATPDRCPECGQASPVPR